MVIRITITAVMVIEESCPLVMMLFQVLTCHLPSPGVGRFLRDVW